MFQEKEIIQKPTKCVQTFIFPHLFDLEGQTTSFVNFSLPSSGGSIARVTTSRVVVSRAIVIGVVVRSVGVRVYFKEEVKDERKVR